MNHTLNSADDNRASYTSTDTQPGLARFMEAKAHAHGIADFGIRSVSRLDKLSARVFAATDDERIAALWDSKTPWEQREALHGCWGEDFEP